MKKSVVPLLVLLSIWMSSSPCHAGNESATPPAVTTGKEMAVEISPLWKVDQSSLESQNWMVHAQNTEIVQGQPGFHAPYSGPNSIYPNDGVRQTISLDLYLGAHLWPGGEIYFNPEYYQGFGFAQTHGFADFSNAEAYKAGESIGGEWIPHAFYRQTIGLGGEQERQTSGQLQLAEKVDISRLTWTVGRIGVTDQFDTNLYANNGRTQFMNWTFVNATAFDYAADTLGSTYGTTIELNQKNYAVRAGIFQMEKAQSANGFDNDLVHAWQAVSEYDQKTSISGHPGVVRLLGWLAEKNVGAFGLTLSNPANNLDTTQTSKYRYEYGFVLNIEQEVARDIGVFLRASLTPGDTPSWNTDVSKNISMGTQLIGELWNRPSDSIGFGTFVSGLNKGYQNYLAQGGQGILVGDGALNYQPEYGLETFYNYRLLEHVTLSADYQLIVDPGYNVDRGPINIFSARLHLDY